MNRFSALSLVLLACTTTYGQTATPSRSTPTPAIAPAAGQTAPANASGPASSAHVNAGRTNGRGTKGSGGIGGSRGARQTSSASSQGAAVGDSRIVVTGESDHIKTGSDDHPLLPIVTAGNAFGIQSGAPIVVKLQQSIDSGHAKNGENLNGTLAQPLAGLPVGTPVELTVVETSPAGQINSYGELSLQVIRIADRTVLSSIVTALGKEGPKELPDAAPGLGTEAVFTAGQPYSLPAA